MKHSTRSLLIVLLLAATTLSLAAAGAEAGGRWRSRHSSYRSQSYCEPYRSQSYCEPYRSQSYCEPRGSWSADWRGGREARWSGGDACAGHPAHRFFDGRAYCAGKTADGCWRSAERCEDDYGHKLVNDPSWVASFRRGCEGGETMSWRGDHRRW